MSDRQARRAPAPLTIDEATRNRFLEILSAVPGCCVSVDSPATPEGEFWFDVTVGAHFRTQASWRAARGFGLFHAEDGAYGARPDLIEPDAERAAAALLRRMAVHTDANVLLR